MLTIQRAQLHKSIQWANDDNNVAHTRRNVLPDPKPTNAQFPCQFRHLNGPSGDTLV